MRFQIIVLLAALLGACSTSYQISQIGAPKDGRPANSVDVSKIPNAKPVPVVRTRAGNAPEYTVLGNTYRVLPTSAGYQQRGEASWYGTKFHGRRTANGEVYNMFAMTAAHTTLPIPSYVQVTHVENGRSVIVRINDRGPFHGNRIIDLSYAAAKKLGVIDTGVAIVDVIDVTPINTSVAAIPIVTTSNIQTNVEPAQTIPVDITSNIQPYIAPVQKLPGGVPLRNQNNFYLQIGAFQQYQSAENLRVKVAAILPHAVNVVAGKDKLYRVFAGPFNTLQQVVNNKAILREKGLSEGYVVRNGIYNN